MARGTRHVGTVEDVEWLADTGAGWAEICQRLDRTEAALIRYLYRQRRGDLVTRLVTHGGRQP